MFVTPEIEVVKFDVVDVVTTSTIEEECQKDNDTPIF